ncbi:MAG: hypothetical protein OEN56_01430 [Gemmatimonadota bacterium]|nr:hypothetical protein [Gemmatimonadota bacterium]
MRPTNKDLVGFVLAASTLGLLVLHGGDRHPALTVTALGGSQNSDRVVAFIDVNLLGSVDASLVQHQVVLVRSGVVSAVGAVGDVSPPRGALVIGGNGSDFLVGADVDPEGRVQGLDASHAIERGARADFLLLPADPRADAGAVRRAEGTMVAGAWYPTGVGPQTDRARAGGGP